MAYTQKDFMEDLALYSAGAIIGVTRSRKFIQFAAKKGIQLAAFGASRVSPSVARGALGVGRATLGAGAGFARRNPAVATGTTLYALNEFGALEPIKETLGELNEAGMQNLQEQFIQPAKRRAQSGKKRVNKFAKAVGAGVKAVKASKFQGAKKKLSNPKKTFATVTKVVSKVNRGKKVAMKGVSGLIARSAKKILGRLR
jgi:hypothetical protein